MAEGIVGGALQPGRVKRQSSEAEGVVVGSLKVEERWWRQEGGKRSLCYRKGI